MKKLATNKTLLILFAVILGVVLFNFGLRLQVQRTYSQIINNAPLVSAFYEANDSALAELSQQHKIEYQKVSDGKLSHSSAGFLPTPNVIAYRQVVAKEVLLPDLQQQLKARVPYKLYMNKGVYVAVPICTIDCQRTMYIVYARAVP